MGGDASPDEVAGLARYLGTQLVAPVENGLVLRPELPPRRVFNRMVPYIKTRALPSGKRSAQFTRDQPAFYTAG
jgi:hypothetical protein